MSLSPNAPMSIPSLKEAAAARLATRNAIVVAGGAMACGVCCVLPFAIPAALLASSGGVLAWVTMAYPWATFVATALVAIAWLLILRQSLSAKRRPARSTMIALVLASILLTTAWVWPSIEPRIIGLL